MIRAFLPTKWVTLEEANLMFAGTAALKPLYVRHFIEDMSWWVCRDDGVQCHKITGPWHSAEVAKLSLDLQKGMES